MMHFVWTALLNSNDFIIIMKMYCYCRKARKNYRKNKIEQQIPHTNESLLILWHFLFIVPVYLLYLLFYLRLPVCLVMRVCVYLRVCVCTCIYISCEQCVSVLTFVCICLCTCANKYLWCATHCVKHRVSCSEQDRLIFVFMHATFSWGRWKGREDMHK